MAVGDTYRAVHQRSLRDPEGFWAEQAKAIDWTRPWDKVLDASGAPFYRWFAGAELNTCYNALDRHVQRGRGEQTALINAPAPNASTHPPCSRDHGRANVTRAPRTSEPAASAPQPSAAAISASRRC